MPEPRSTQLATRREAIAKIWPMVPFWLRGKIEHHELVAVAGAAVSATALIAILCYEVVFLSWEPLLSEFLSDGYFLLFLTLLSPLLTLTTLSLSGGRHVIRPGQALLGLLPVFGLFVLAAAQASLASERKRRSATEIPSRIDLQKRLRRSLRLPEKLAQILRKSHGSMTFTGLLWGSHLAWLLSATAFAIRRNWTEAIFPPGAVLCFACLHLCAMAAALLMMDHEGNRRTLARSRFPRLSLVSPYLLLLPLPLNFLGVLTWSTPNLKRQEEPLLVRLPFSAQGPLGRLRAFRQLTLGEDSLRLVMQDVPRSPLELPAEARVLQEELWLEGHRSVLTLQTALIGSLAIQFAAQVGLLLGGIALLALAISAISWLVLRGGILVGRSSTHSPVLVRARMWISASFPIFAGTLAGVVSWTPYILAQLCILLSILMLLCLPLDILTHRGRFRFLPASLLRLFLFAGLAVLVAAANHYAPELTLFLLQALFWASLTFSFILVRLAKKLAAPTLVCSPWLAYPFSLVRLPFVVEAKPQLAR